MIILKNHDFSFNRANTVAYIIK